MGLKETYQSDFLSETTTPVCQISLKMLLFLQVYPDALAQAIYAVYHEAFPESERHFDDEFKQKLVYTVFEWISGKRVK